MTADDPSASVSSPVRLEALHAHRVQIGETGANT